MSDSGRRVTPTPLGDVLAGTRQVALRRSKAALDRDTWRRAVGRRIAERTDVGALRDGELTVYVASAAWAQELSLLTREITGCLEALGIHVQRVRFSVRTELRLRTQKAPAPKPRKVRPLPPQLAAQIDRIEDTELRDAIREAAGLALARIDKEAAEPRRTTPATSKASDTPSGVPRSAPSPRGAAEQTARSDRSSAGGPAGARDRRGGRQG